MSDIIKMKQFCVVIPYMFLNITKERVAEVFESQDYGRVANIDFLEKTDKNTGKKYKMAFLYFEEWFANDCAARFRRDLEDGKTCRVVYNDPAFWTVAPFVKKSARRKHAVEKNAENTMQLVDTEYITRIENELFEAREEITRLLTKTEMTKTV